MFCSHFTAHIIHQINLHHKLFRSSLFSSLIGLQLFIESLRKFPYVFYIEWVFTSTNLLATVKRTRFCVSRNKKWFTSSFIVRYFLWWVALGPYIFVVMQSWLAPWPCASDLKKKILLLSTINPTFSITDWTTTERSFSNKIILKIQYNTLTLNTLF